MKGRRSGDTQFAALPWRVGPGARRQVMLLTSRETRRWVIPKGWPMKGRKPREVARQEAYEEAGIVGKIMSKRPLGSYHYQKKLPHTEVLCVVLVFSLYVESQLDDWPERQERRTRWFDAIEAASLVDEGGLAGIIERFAGDATRFVVFARH